MRRTMTSISTFTGARTGLTAAALTLALALVTGCTDGEDTNTPAPTGGGESAPTSPAEEGQTQEEPGDGPLAMPSDVDDQLRSLDPESLDVLGSGTGKIDFADTSFTADVLQVRRHEGGLDLTFRLTPEDEVSSHPFSQQLSFDQESNEINGVRLISGEEYVAPMLYQMDPDKWDVDVARCLCSKLPQKITTDGFVLHASYPDFDEAVDTVDVAIPGFKKIEDIPIR